LQEHSRPRLKLARTQARPRQVKNGGES
jgi:hypothetical protein